MNEDVYTRLAAVLDTLPNGFPGTESGMEIKLLKKIFRPEDADLFCDLRLNFETAQQIADRTGRSLDGLEAHLCEMGRRGQIFAIEVDGIKIFKMVPWAFGIYEFQLAHMDRELAEMCEAYWPVYAIPFFKIKPQLMQVIPIEKEIKGSHEALPYERVSAIIEQGKSFLVQDCICKKEQGLLDHPCTKPMEVCLAIAPIEGVFDHYGRGRTLTREQAYAVLADCEAKGLVHLTWNVQGGHYFICNCCGCCCGVLRSINEWDISKGVNSSYYARIDPDACVSCGVCASERCQVRAIEEKEDTFSVIREKCIGCGLCVSTCPSDAIQLIRKHPDEIVTPPTDEMDWYVQRGKQRGRDFSAFK
ncbi:MAG: 4Fe-4S dicluster-binding protein [Desulfatirhabdiaceae bacterium]